MKYVYPACFYKEENGTISVVFPDLGDLATQGDNMVEAMEMAADAAAGWIVETLENGDTIPQPSDPKGIIPEDDAGHVSEVFIDISDAVKSNSKRLVKKTLTIPEWVNEAGEKNDINFSATLTEAIIEKIQGVG